MLPILSLRPNYNEIEPGICDLVRAINSLGIKTFTSCEGHTDPCRPAYPHVAIDFDSAKRQGFRILILAISVLNRDFFGKWTLFPKESGDGSALLFVKPVFASSRNLDRTQIQAKKLAGIIDAIRDARQAAR